METMKAIARRKSTRGYKPELVPEEVLDKILRAGSAGPVGFNEYDTLHFTVIQDKAILDQIVQGGYEYFKDPQLNILYGAPTLVVISSGVGRVEELAPANVGCVAENMMLAAADMGVDSVYIWSTSMSYKVDRALYDLTKIPDGFQVMGSVALGYAEEPDDSEKPMDMVIEVTRI